MQNTIKMSLRNLHSCIKDRPILYYMDSSPPSRFALMTIKALNLYVELKEVNIFRNEHHSQEYTKLNPIRQIPTLQHGMAVVRDSHAICCYLANSFRPESSLYPREPLARARVDQTLCFDMGTFFPRNSDIMCDYFQRGIKFPEPFKASKMAAAYKLLDTFLTDHKWLAGDVVTLADFCCLATLCSAELLVPLDKEKYPRAAEWVARLKRDPIHIECNQPGVENLKKQMESWDLADYM